jgi:hypothetical protein
MAKSSLSTQIRPRSENLLRLLGVLDHFWRGQRPGSLAGQIRWEQQAGDQEGCYTQFHCVNAAS